MTASGNGGPGAIRAIAAMPASQPSRANAIARCPSASRAKIDSAGAVQGRARADRERFLLAHVVVELAATVVGPDFDQPYRSLLNLVRNAFDAGARAVRLSGENTGDSAVIEVADDGPGMPEEVAARIGQDQRSGTEGGSGLGLRICADLCHNHGGALAVAARGPEGTRIRVTLPFAATG